MATDPILLRAILAMDAYNRGYDAGIKDLGGESATIGEATLGKDATQLLDSGSAQAAGFYAAAYTISGGGTVISYRGTDANFPNPFGAIGGDLINGYGLAAGFANSNQTRLAVLFYQSIAGSVSYQSGSNVVLTGHSLGGGLAGFVGAIYGKTGSLFDNMKFERGAAEAYKEATAGSGTYGIVNTELRDLLYGSSRRTDGQNEEL